jgi:hypothetical protein
LVGWSTSSGGFARLADAFIWSDLIKAQAPLTKAGPLESVATVIVVTPAPDTGGLRIRRAIRHDDRRPLGRSDLTTPAVAAPDTTRRDGAAQTAEQAVQSRSAQTRPDRSERGAVHRLRRTHPPYPGHGAKQGPDCEYKPSAQGTLTSFKPRTIPCGLRFEEAQADQFLHLRGEGKPR